jgi:hypothetical protein
MSRRVNGIQAKAALHDGWLSARERLADVPEKEDLPFEHHHHRALVTSESNDMWPMSPSSSLWLHHEKGPHTSTWRDAESTLDTWIQGLGPNQGGTHICSVASSVADRRVRYRQHAVGCADGWAREERPERVSV